MSLPIYKVIWRFSRSRSVALGQSWVEYVAAMRAHEDAVVEWLILMDRTRHLNNLYVNISYDSVVGVFTDADTAVLAKLSIVANEESAPRI